MDSTNFPTSPEPTILAADSARLRQHLDAIPPGKKGALIIAADWKFGVPVSARFGVATRVGEHLSLGAEYEHKFKQAPPSSTFYTAWTWVLLLGVLLPAPARAQQPTTDAFHQVPLAGVATTRWTHVCTSGNVVYVRRQADGDAHITLDNGRATVVLEIIPAVPLPAPRKGQTIEACGITRIDRGHRTTRYPNGWPELHPLLSWRVAP